METHRKREQNSRFPSVITLVIVRTTKKIVGPPDPLSWWSCGPLLIKVCVKPCYANKNKVFFVIFVGHMGLKHVYLVQIRYLEHNLVKSGL